MSDAWGGLGTEVHCTNDLAFVLPERRPWIDRTVQRLELPGDGEHLCVLLIERTPMAPGDTLDDLVTAASRRAGRERRGHEVLQRSSCVVAGQSGIEVAVRWAGPDGAMYVRQVHLVVNGAWIGIGVSGRVEDTELCDRAARRVSATLQIRTLG